MTQEPNFAGIYGLLAAALIYVWFYTAWQSLVVDAVRQKMFEVRDNAFLWAVDNNKLNEKSYQDFRSTINAAIRQYERMSVFKLFVLSKLLNSDEKKQASRHPFFHDEYLLNAFNSVITVSSLGLILRSILVIPLMIVLPLVFLQVLLTGSFMKLLSSPLPSTLSKRVAAGLLIAS